MSQQINLINPAFRKVFDWLTAAPLAIAACILLVTIGAAVGWATMRADKQEQAANQKSATLKATQDKLVAMSKLVAESKPNTELASELANTVTLLKNRAEVIRALEGGVIGSTTGFAEFLRGFARQTPKGLWLTGFTIGASGSDMEIRGRMVNPSALPEYIRRLKTEPVFQGRSFASLSIQRPAEGKEKKALEAMLDASAKQGVATPTAAKEVPPNFVDFVLKPSSPDEVAAAALAASLQATKLASTPPRPPAPDGPQKQGFVDPVLTPKTENLGRAAMEELQKGNAEQAKTQAAAMKKLQELLPTEKKP